MACFIVPGTEAIVTTAITKIVEKKEKKEICSCETEGAVEAVKEEVHIVVNEWLDCECAVIISNCKRELSVLSTYTN